MLQYLLLGMSCLLTGWAWQEASSPEYLALSAQQKHEILLSNVNEDTSSGAWPGLLDLPGIFTESMCPTLRQPGDDLPWEEGIFSDGWRVKYIHTVGAVGQVEWRPVDGHSYSGMFSGGSHGWVRLSLAQQPSPPALKTAPGMGLKLLRSGRDSANLVAMFSVNGQESWNFFKNNFTNHIGPGGPELIPLEIKFQEATNYISEVGLSDMARYDEAGAETDDPQFPFMLTFVPNKELGFPDEYVRPFTEDLVSVPADSLLYRVVARDQPLELGGVDRHIADLVLVGGLTTSMWGDQHLFFRHQDMAEDVMLRPEWEPYLDKFGFEHESGCPLAARRRTGKRANK